MIERNVEIRNSMVMSFSKIKRGVIMNGAIVGRHSTIGTNCILDAHQSHANGKIPVIGEDLVLPAESTVLPGTRVAPLKYSHRVLATGKFAELGVDDRNIYFIEKAR